MPDKKKNDAKKNDEEEDWRPSKAQVGKAAALAIGGRAAETAFDQVKEYVSSS